MKGRSRTFVMEGRADVDVRAPGRADVGQRRLDGVVRPELGGASGQRTGGSARARGRTVSISMTVLKPFSDSLEIGARKFPAAPAKVIHQRRRNRTEM